MLHKLALKIKRNYVFDSWCRHCENNEQNPEYDNRSLYNNQSSESGFEMSRDFLFPKVDF